MSFEVLVCGGRTYGIPRSPAPEDMSRAVGQQQHVNYTLHGRGITKIIEGGAPGADRQARKWGVANNIPVQTFDADWKTHGRAAGPIRNAEMLKTKPHLVIAFAGGAGTRDMVRQARDAGIPVEEHAAV